MTISVNEQVTGHKVTVRSAAPTRSGQRRASCECGWTSSIGSTERVMPEIRTHLEGGAWQLASGQWGRRPSLAPGPSGCDVHMTWTLWTA